MVKRNALCSKYRKYKKKTFMRQAHKDFLCQFLFQGSSGPSSCLWILENPCPSLLKFHGRMLLPGSSFPVVGVPYHRVPRHRVRSQREHRPCQNRSSYLPADNASRVSFNWGPALWAKISLCRNLLSTFTTIFISFLCFVQS